MSCKHEQRWEWDCSCTFGPPSCSSCHIKSECAKCGELLKSEPNVKQCLTWQTPGGWRCVQIAGHEGRHDDKRP